ncbi:cilia- and flagella-associated protein 58-like [Pseudochaenichthys georgianus]|uniref:cilia- and flagella-associated protein 58-like n=1 Tax=Pseudochaenichthys georgianus TaxID=52239 RepID=UPI001469A469|nr:NF-kappa-B essential modulator-like [Pseudochaenichthys georgianus]
MTDQFERVFVETAGAEQLRSLVKHLIKTTQETETVSRENCVLSRQVEVLQIKEKEYKLVLIELRDVKIQLKKRQDISKALKAKKEDFLQQAAQLDMVTKERNSLIKMLPYKKECLLLRQQKRDLEVTIQNKEKDQREEIHVYIQEVEKLRNQTRRMKEKGSRLQVEKTGLLDEITRLQEEKNNLHKEIEYNQRREEEQSLTLQNRCSLLEERVYWARDKVMEIHPGRTFAALGMPGTHIKITPEETEADLKNRELSQMLKAHCDQLDKNKEIINEKERQYEELKNRTARLLPPERFDMIPKYQCVIREQSQQIKALMGAVNCHQTKAEEYRGDQEKIVEKATAYQKLYLKEKMENNDLREFLKEGVTKPDNKYSAIQVPAGTKVLQKQSREKHVATKMPGLKSSLAYLPPITKKSQQVPEVKLDHIQSTAIPKKTEPKYNHFGRRALAGYSFCFARRR